MIDSDAPDGGEDGTAAFDPGLAAERTDIAWSRSALALVTCGAAVLRRVPSMSRATGAAIVVLVALMLAAAGLVLRRRLATHDRDPAIAVARLRLRNLAAMTSLTGALCLIVITMTVDR